MSDACAAIGCEHYGGSNSRVPGNYRSLSEVVTGTLETDFDVEDMAVKLASGEEVHVDFAPVKWAVDGQHSKTMWKVRGRVLDGCWSRSSG